MDISKKVTAPLFAFRIDPEDKDLLVALAKEDRNSLAEELRFLVRREYVRREILRKNGYPVRSIFSENS